MSTMNTIIGIDPGTSCGWAVSSGGTFAGGTWDLSTSRWEGGGMRYVKFRKSFTELLDSTAPDLVAYEEVQGRQYPAAAHVYGGIVAILTSVCEDLGIPYTSIPVGTIKKHATGKGNSNKDAMLAAAKERWPELEVVDDNMADALFIAELGRKQAAA